MKYVPELDGLRGIAVLLVVLVHCKVPGFAGGFLGVDVFFVLSGYLITSILLAEHRAGAIDLRRFYWRRALRLYPALLLMLTVYLIVAPILWPGKPHWRDALLAGFYLSDYSYAFIQAPHYLSHTWSLAVEEHFYMLWPPLLILALRKRPADLSQILLVALLAAIAWRWYSIDALRGVYFRFDSRLPGLLAGCWLATARPRLRLPERPVAWLGLGMLIFVVATAITGGRGSVTYSIPMAEAASVLLIYGAASLPFLAQAKLVEIGRLSYGIYLWHAPLMYAVQDWSWPEKLLFVSVASFIAAWVSYHTVEAVARSYRHPRSPTISAVRMETHG